MRCHYGIIYSHNANGQSGLRTGWLRTGGAWAALLAMLGHIMMTPAWAAAPLPNALPQQGVVDVGSASIAQTAPNHLQIDTATPQTAITWQSFDVGTDAAVTIQQPTADSITLNRATNTAPSRIFGSVQSNGRVIVANPNGVWFGPNAHVDAAGIVAAAADMPSAAVLADSAVLDASTASAGVMNEGRLSANNQQAGVVLAGRAVRNAGRITTADGQTSLAAGGQFKINLTKDALLEIEVTAPAAITALPNGNMASAAVSNQGRIDAGQGAVRLQAAMVGAALDEAINVSGINEAQRAVVQGKKITLESTAVGVVRVAGDLDASAKTADTAGGAIKVFGHKIALEDSATLTATAKGNGAGGTILVGGDYLGQKTAAAPANNAALTYVASTAKLDASADAAGAGAGGKIIVWADQATYYAGAAAVNAGQVGGDGGLIEVSGAETLVFKGTASALAPNGQLGTILLDPRDITIAATGPDDSNIASHSLFANPNTTTDVQFSASVVQALTGAVQLQASRNIIINSALNFNNPLTTSVAFRAGQNITISAPVQASGGGSISFTANDVGSTTRLATATITSSANIGGASTGALSFSNSGGSGALILSGNQTWQTNNAAITVTMTGSQIRGDVGNNNRTLTVNAGTGTVNLGAIGNGTNVPGAVNITGGAVTVGAVITGAGGLTRAGGAFTITASGAVNAGAITTSGGATGGAGLAGGAINITGAGITVTGALTTTGGAAAAGNNNGGNAGNVTLNATGANTATFTSISGVGGVGFGTGTGGAGSAVNLTASNGITGAGNITLTGGNAAGAAGTNGAGGNITFNHNFVMNVNANIGINNTGGTTAGAAGGAGGTQTYSGSFSFTPGAANRTITFNAGSGSVLFSDNTVTASNSAAIDLTADILQLPSTAGYVNTAGNVALRPGRDTTTIGIGSTGVGSFLIDQSEILSINPAIGTLTIGRGTGTGLITISGAAAFNSDNVTIQAGGNGGNILFTSTADFDMATSGNRTLTLISGSGATNNITFQAGAVLTNNSGGTGSTVFSTYNLVLLGVSGAINGNGGLTIQPPVDAGTMGVGTGAAGTLQVTQALLDAMPSFTSVTFGRGSSTTTLEVGGSFSQNRSYTLRAGGAGGTVNILATANLSVGTTGNRTITLASGSGGADALAIQPGAVITNNSGTTGAVVLTTNNLSTTPTAGSITGNGTLTIQSVGNGNTMGIGTGAGQLQLTQARLDAFAGFVSQTLGRAYTSVLSINGAVNLARTTSITASGGNGAINIGSTAAITVGGTTQNLTFTSGSGTSYTGTPAINSITLAAGGAIANASGGTITFTTNNFVAGSAGSITSSGNINLQPTADTVTLGIGSGTGQQTVYSQAVVDQFTLATSTLQLGRTGSTVGAVIGGAVNLANRTTIRASGAAGYIRLLGTANVVMTGTNHTLNLQAGSGTTFTGTPAINSITLEAGAQITNNSGATGAVVLQANNYVIDATASITGNGIITLQPTAAGNSIGVVGGAGILQLTQAQLDRLFNFIQLNIGRTDGTAITTVNGALDLVRNTTLRQPAANGAVDFGASTALTMTGTNLTLTVLPGSGTGGSATQNIITAAAGASITNNTGAGGLINFNTNRIALNSAASISGDGVLEITPNAANQTVGLGTGTGNLSIDATELATFSGFTEQRFGSLSGTALLNINGTLVFNRSTVLRSGGAGGTINNNATAALTVAGTANLTYITGSGAADAFTHTSGATLALGTGTLDIQANTIALAGANSISGAGALIVQPTVAATPIGIAGGTGTLALSAAHLDVFGSFTSQTFGRTDGVGLITANAVNFARATTIRGATAAFTSAGALAVTPAAANFSIAVNGPITLGGNLTTSGGNLLLGNGAVVLGADINLSSAGGTVTLGGTVNSDATTRNLTINAGTGQVILANALGAIAPLGAVSFTAGNNLALPALTTTGAGGNIDVTLTAGNLTQTGVLTVTGNSTFAANTAAGQQITLTQANLLAGLVTASTHATTGGAGNSQHSCYHWRGDSSG